MDSSAWKTRDLAASIEKGRQELANYGAQIADLERKSAVVQGQLAATAAEKSHAELELSSSKKEDRELRQSIVVTKIAHINESLAAFMFAKLAASIPNAASPFSVISTPEESDIRESIRAYLGDPYQDTRNLVVAYFDPANTVFNAPEVVDPLRAEIKSSLLEALDSLATTIVIPEHAFEDCKNIVETYRVKLKPIDEERKSLTFRTPNYVSRLEEVSNQIMDLQKSAMKQLSDLKASQYGVFSVMPLVVRDAFQKVAKFEGLSPGQINFAPF